MDEYMREMRIVESVKRWIRMKLVSDAGSGSHICEDPSELMRIARHDATCSQSSSEDSPGDRSFKQRFSHHPY